MELLHILSCPLNRPFGHSCHTDLTFVFHHLYQCDIDGDSFFSDLKNRVAAGFILRSRTQLLCSAGIGAEPQQARNCRFPQERKLAVFAKWVPLCIACRFLRPFVPSRPLKNIFQKLSKKLRPTPIKSYL